MSRKLLIAIAVMSVAFVGTTFAGVENIKVSGDINLQAVSRDLSLGKESGPNIDAEDFLFSQTRLRFDADLTEGVSAVLRLLNEKIWGTDDAAAARDDLDLDLAYVELKEFMYQPLTLIVGRQNLRYGNGFIIGDPNTNQLVAVADGGAAITQAAFADLSLRKSFDAVRAILDFSPFTLDLVYAKIDENSNNLRDDETLIGANLAYDWSSYNGVTELYAFYKDGTNAVQEGKNDDNILTLGGRAQFDLNDHLTLGVEGAHQFGDYISGSANLNRDSWAAQFVSEYRFLNDYNAKLGVTYSYYSGEDRNITDSKYYSAWDPMYEDQTLGELANIYMATTNLSAITLTGSIMPREDLTIGATYLYAWLDEGLSAFAGPTGSAIAGQTYAVESNKEELANEVDVYSVFDYTEDVQISLNTAVLVPGALFDDTNDQLAYSVRVGMNVDF